MATWDYSLFWEESINQIKEKYTTENKSSHFDMWFAQLAYKKSTENKIEISLPSQFFLDQFIIKNYKQELEDKLLEISGKNLKIDCIIEKNKIVNNNTFSEKNEQKKEEVKKIKKHPDLNADYTFNSFVIGDNSSFAYNAAIAISKNPGKAYNPILISGGVGLGKTHLIQAIGNESYKNNNLKIIYITAENFTNEFIQSLNNKTPQKFKNKYRSADILLIDDIHFLQNKDGTQEELFHTFNALYDSYKQIVFTCDRPVSELKNITDRLKNRFERGLNVDLFPPNYETRRAILETKLTHLKTKMSPDIINCIPPEVIDYIAQNVETNVRDLESSLTKMIAYAELVENKITLEIAQQQLKGRFLLNDTLNINIDIIQRNVANEYNISLADIKGKKRTKTVTLPRQIAMYIAQQLTEYSTTEIGIEFGGRDHTTVMHSCQKINQLIVTDPKLNSKIQYIIKTIKENKK